MNAPPLADSGPLVLPLAGILACDPEALEAADGLLAGRFGTPLFAFPATPFTHTDYYVPQTGALAYKTVRVYAPVHAPPLAEWKRWALQGEEALGASLGRPVPRPVNLDPGYLTLGAVVLASTKEARHRIWLGDGIWAELTLFWRRGRFESFAWTYPDFQGAELREFLGRARKALRQARGREGRPV